jgi:phosphatidate cytidylyltransferase
VASDPALRPPPGASVARAGGELRLRVASAAVMALAAVGTAYWGGWPFALFWLLAGLGVLWEWGRFVSVSVAQRLVAIGAAAAVSAALARAFEDTSAVAVTALVALVAAAFAGRAWGAAGLLYAGSLAVAPIVLRADPEWGGAAIALLFAVVWGTDIAAYFGGRRFGGPKLWPAVSPHKTWSGALTGAAVGVVGGIVVAAVAGAPDLAAVALLSLALSVAAQLGDLLESAIKRRFGAKDASHIIPGHGGLMDRLDGFVTAAVLAAAIGVLRGGLEAPSLGLFMW